MVNAVFSAWAFCVGATGPALTKQATRNFGGIVIRNEKPTPVKRAGLEFSKEAHDF